MFRQRQNPNGNSTELPDTVNGLPVFDFEEPFVLSNDDEIVRLESTQASTFVRVCKFGLFGHRSSSRWFRDIREIIDIAEKEYDALKVDCGLAIPEHKWGIIPNDKIIKGKIRNGFKGRREAFYDKELLPKGYLLGCEIERVETSLKFDRMLTDKKPGYVTPEDYAFLWDSMTDHLTTYGREHAFRHADLSPEQCLVGTTEQRSGLLTYLVDLEPVIKPIHLR